LREPADAGRTQGAVTMKAPAKRIGGQGLVEFALVIPILMLLLIGIVDLSRAWMAKNVVTAAAREGARGYAIADGNYGAGVSRCNQVLSSAGLNGASCSGSLVGGGGPGAPSTVVWTASYPFQVTIAGFIPGIPGTTLQLSSTTTMLKE